MKYKKLGNTGFMVSEMGFGGIPIMSGRESEFLVDLKDINYNETIKTIKHAFENGINFYDTALDYRDSEEKIGKALHGVRDKIYLASKSKALTYEQMKKDVVKSLRNLDVDYIDLYQLHFVRDKKSYDTIMDEKSGAYRALLELQDKGVIKTIGIATHNAFILEPAIRSKKFCCIQIPVNLIEQECISIVDLAIEYGIGIIGMKPYAGGALVKPLPKIKDLEVSSDTMKKIALAYVFSQNITTAIPGVATITELDENLSIYYGYSSLSVGELEKINVIRDRLGKVFCRRCQYCEPCPQGIEISKILRLIKYYEDYNLEGWAKEQYFNIKNKPDKCMKCYICEKKCPYDIKIVTELERIHGILSEDNYFQRT